MSSILPFFSIEADGVEVETGFAVTSIVVTGVAPDVPIKPKDAKC